MKRPKNQNLTSDELREILSLPNHVFAVIRPDSTFYKVNEEANPVLGWEPDEVIGEPLKKYIHADDWEETLARMTGLFLGTTALITDMTIRCLHKNGSYRWLSWTAKARGGFIYSLGVDVTEKIEYEEALSVQSLVLESISEGVMIFNQEGVIVFANTAAEKLFSYDTEELLGKKISILSGYPKERTREEIQNALAVIQQKGIWAGEWQNIRKDGELVITACRVTTLALNGDNHFVCVQRDITQRKKNQQALEELQGRFTVASERLSLAVKVSKIGIWEWMYGTDTVIWDETTESIYGYEKGTFPGTAAAYTECVYTEDRDFTWNLVTKSVAKREPYVMDHRIIRKDGRIRWVQGSGMAFYNPDGTPYRLMGTVQDITERKEAEQDQKFLAEVSETLSSSLDYRENLATFAQQASKYFCDGVFIDQLHPDGSIERIVVTHPHPEMADKIRSIHEKHLQRYQNDHPLLTALVTGKTVFQPDVRQTLSEMRQKHGEEYARALEELKLKSTIILRLRGRESLLGTLTFFTTLESQKEFGKRHLRLAEELAYRVSMSLENSLLYLNSQEAIRARDEFLSIASHELKTPLQSLTLQNHMRKRQLEKGHPDLFSVEKLTKALDLDNRQLIRINRLIDDMLDIARIRADRLTIHKEKFDLCSLVSEVVERFRPQFEAAGCLLTLNLCKDIQISADSYRIEQVIVNLLTNAMKYGAGGSVRVEVVTHPKKISVLVHDRGPGIDQSDFERIFQRFERAVSSSEVSGLGLGLYISRQIVEQHDGSLSVTSEKGKGSTFIMELPIES